MPASTLVIVLTRTPPKDCLFRPRIVRFAHLVGDVLYVRELAVATNDKYGTLNRRTLPAESVTAS
jgi:hypothetical protein